MNAELSSMSSTLNTMHTRLGRLAETLDTEKDAELLAALYEAERTMRSASRQLERAARAARH